MPDAPRFRNAGLPRDGARVESKLMRVCPICQDPGVHPKGLANHIRIVHGIDRVRALELARGSEVSPMVWLDALEKAEEHLAFVTNKLKEKNLPRHALYSLELARKILKKQVSVILEAGHDFERRFEETGEF